LCITTALAMEAMKREAASALLVKMASVWPEECSATKAIPASRSSTLLGYQSRGVLVEKHNLITLDERQIPRGPRLNASIL